MKTFEKYFEEETFFLLLNVDQELLNSRIKTKMLILSFKFVPINEEL